MRSSTLGMVALMLMGGCAESHGVPEPLPDVPRTTRLGELTEDQFREYCDWTEALSGGEEYVMCADGGMLGRFDPETCFELRVYYPPECPALLGDAIECQTTMLNDCLAGVPHDEPLPACMRARNCSEP